MDPQKLTAYELVQLCPNGQDEASGQEFVRRFMRSIPGVVAQSILHQCHLGDDLQIDDLQIGICSVGFPEMRTSDLRFARPLLLTKPTPPPSNFFGIQDW
jgi:hypothetical protein